MFYFGLNYVIFIFFFYVETVVSTNVYMEMFKNYSIYQVTAFNNRERAVLYALYIKVDDIIFVNGVTNEASVPMDVLVDKCCINEFETIMQSNDIEFVKVLPSKIIKIPEDIKGHHLEHLNFKDEHLISTKFLYYDVIRQWVKYATKKNSVLEEIKIGETYEKRDIFVLRLSTGDNKRAVFLMGGEEGRDWTSPAILINLISNILNRKKQLDVLLKYYEFYILPVFNPDGYMYSMIKDRVWSKNSRVYYTKELCSGNVSAIGVTVDRNWYFNKANIKNEDCDPIFLGMKTLSEEETIAVSNFLNKIALKLMAFINIRGFANLITIPYAYNKMCCNNYDVLIDMAAAVHQSVLRKHNTTFYYGLSSKYIYNFSGNVADWVKKELNTPIVYTIYLKYGTYVLPSTTDILPLTAHFITMIKEILHLANIFYDPLFNGQSRNANTIPIVMIYNLCFHIIIKLNV